MKLYLEMFVFYCLQLTLHTLFKNITFEYSKKFKFFKINSLANRFGFFTIIFYGRPLLVD